MILRQAVILVGGLGSRLGNLTKNVPKPILKINKKRFLDILIENFARYGIKKIYLLTSYKFKKFEKIYNNKIFNSTKIVCINEGLPKGTGGALIKSIKRFDQYFLFCNGDTFFDINYLDFFLNSNKSKAINIAITNKNKNKRFSYVKIKSNSIIDFNIKYGDFVNSGYYIINKKKLINKPKNIKSLSLEKDIFPELIKKNQINFVKFNKEFLDIGVKKDLNKADNYLYNNLKKKVAILDRDGVINYDFGYVHKMNKFKLKPNIIDLIKFLNDKNYFVFVVTNQSGIGRGYYSEKDVKKLHNYLDYKLNKKGAHIDEYFISPYFKFSKSKKYRFGSKYRKPNIGFFNQIKKNYPIKLKGSFMIGDQKTDYLFAKKSKIQYFDVKKIGSLLNLKFLI